MRAFAFAIALMFALATGSSAQSLAANPVVHAGDRLQIQVSGETEVSQEVVVADDGTIGLPLIGQIHVAGATPHDAGTAIAHALQRYMRDPRVIVAVVNAGQISVLVLGDVVNSGEYELRPGARLSDAVTAAGGMDPSISGEYPVARIALADGSTDHISLEKLLRGGDPTRDIVLSDRAAVYVPGPTQFDISVLGAVDHPGTLTLNEGDRLSIAIAKAGTTRASRADLNQILVTRTEPDGKTASHPVDLYESLVKGDSRFDPRLQKGDIVYVPIAKKPLDYLTIISVLSRLIFL